MKRDRKGDHGRRFAPPTRRAFVAMLGATAAALVLRDRTPATVVRHPETGKPIWVGHF
ncbi:MAG: hypothetical protein ACTHU0_26660 [Kofleriaceae bacterium]